MTFNGGNITVDKLVATNGATSAIAFNSGILNTRGTTVTSAAPFVVGNGTDAATFNLLGGNHSFANGLNISSNAALTGSGTISAVLTIADGGHLAPGNSAGTQTVSALVLSPFSQLDFELGSPTGTNDFIAVTGALTLDGVLNISSLPGFSTGTYVIATYGGLLTDHGLEVGAMPNGFRGILTVGGGYVDLEVVPEPTTLILVVVGACTSLVLRRRSKASRR